MIFICMGALTGGSIASAASDREGCGGDASGGVGGEGGDGLVEAP